MLTYPSFTHRELERRSYLMARGLFDLGITDVFHYIIFIRYSFRKRGVFPRHDSSNVWKIYSKTLSICIHLEYDPARSQWACQRSIKIGFVKKK
jgi:hypothetical protein